MKLTQNPYKDLPKDEKKIISFEVSKEHWMILWLAFPFRGLADQVMSVLFYRFIKGIQQNLNLQKHYEPANASTIESYLRRASFPRADNDVGEPGSVERRREACTD